MSRESNAAVFPRMARTAGMGLFLALLSSTAPVHGQDVITTGPAPAEAPVRGIVVGGTLGGGSEGLAGAASVSFPVASGELILRAAGTTEFSILGPASTSVGDMGVLYAFRPVQGRAGWLRLGGGVAMVDATRPGDVVSCAFIFCDYETESSRTVGLAFQADAMWAISRPFGLGLALFGNLNSQQSFVGIGLNVAFGRLR